MFQYDNIVIIKVERNNCFFLCWSVWSWSFLNDRNPRNDDRSPGSPGNENRYCTALNQIRKQCHCTIRCLCNTHLGIPLDLIVYLRTSPQVWLSMANIALVKFKSNNQGGL